MFSKVGRFATCAILVGLFSFQNSYASPRVSRASTVASSGQIRAICGANGIPEKIYIGNSLKYKNPLSTALHLPVSAGKASLQVKQTKKVLLAAQNLCSQADSQQAIAPLSSVTDAAFCPDLNGDHNVNINDLMTALNLYAAGTLPDFNGNGIKDPGDMTAYRVLFRQYSGRIVDCSIPPTPTPTPPVMCTPVSCQPPGHLVCPLSSCPNGCGYVCVIDPTKTPTATPSPTVTFTRTATPTASRTPTPPGNGILTPTPTPMRTATVTPSPTRTSTPSATPTPTSTPSGSSGPLVAAVTASRSSGTVPLAVMFSGKASTPADQIGRFTWNFGDGSPEFAGFNAAHVYETPNTYTVTLRIEDSAGHVATRSLQVSALAVAGPVYYVDSVSGSDGNAGLSQTGAWKTAAFALSQVQGNRKVQAGSQVLFKRGQVFPLATRVDLSNTSGPITIAAFGSGNKPILRWDSSLGEGGLMAIMYNVADMRFADLEIDGQSPSLAHSDTISRAAAFQSSIGVVNTLFLRLSVHNLGSFLIQSGNTSDSFFLFDNDGHDFLNEAIYTANSYATTGKQQLRIAMVGNHFELINLHPAYLTANDSVIAENYFGRWAWGKDFRIVGIGSDDNLVTRNTFEGWIDPAVTVNGVNCDGYGDCHGGAGRYSNGLSHFGHNGASGMYGSHIEFSDNLLVNFNSNGVVANGGISNMLIANNVFVSPSNSGTNIIAVDQEGGTGVTNHDIKILNNTLVLNGAAPAIALYNNYYNISVQNNVLADLGSNSVNNNVAALGLGNLVRLGAANSAGLFTTLPNLSSGPVPLTVYQGLVPATGSPFD